MGGALDIKSHCTLSGVQLPVASTSVSMGSCAHQNGKLRPSKWEVAPIKMCLLTAWFHGVEG